MLVWFWVYISWKVIVLCLLHKFLQMYTHERPNYSKNITLVSSLRFVIIERLSQSVATSSQEVRIRKTEASTMKVFRKKKYQSCNSYLYKTLIQFFTPVAWQSLMGQVLLLVEVSRSHSDTRQSIGLLWTSDWPVAKTSTRRHTILTRDNVRVLNGFRKRSPSKRAAANSRFRPRGTML